MTRRLAAWVHYVKHEPGPNLDRLLMAQDIERLLAVAEAAKIHVELWDMGRTMPGFPFDRDRAHPIDPRYKPGAALGLAEALAALEASE